MKRLSYNNITHSKYHLVYKFTKNSRNAKDQMLTRKNDVPHERMTAERLIQLESVSKATKALHNPQGTLLKCQIYGLPYSLGGSRIEE